MLLYFSAAQGCTRVQVLLSCGKEQVARMLRSR